MREPNQMYSGLSNAAWGYFFVTFDFSLNNVSILPRFVGYLLLLSAIGKLSDFRRDLALLRPLCMLLVCCSLGDWLLSWVGWDIDGMIPFLDLVVTVATLYFHFQFLTDLAALAEGVQPEDDNLAAKLRSYRTAYTLLFTAALLLGSAAQVSQWDRWSGIVIFMGIIACIVVLMIMADLFRLRKYVGENGPGMLE